MLPVKSLDRFLQLANIVECEFPRLGELRHHWLGASSEETQNLVEQTVPRDIAGDERLKDVGIPDLADASNGLLSFQAVYGRLDSRVCRARFRKVFLDFANGCLSMGPEGLQDLKFEPGEFRLDHASSTMSYLMLLRYSRPVKGKIIEPRPSGSGAWLNTSPRSLTVAALSKPTASLRVHPAIVSMRRDQGCSSRAAPTRPSCPA